MYIGTKVKKSCMRFEQGQGSHFNDFLPTPPEKLLNIFMIIKTEKFLRQ